jgi:hypothetical protein
MTTALGDIIATYVAEQPTSRVRVDGLLRHATAADPTLVGDPTARTRLAAVLAGLAEAGAVVLPKTRSGWGRPDEPAPTALGGQDRAPPGPVDTGTASLAASARSSRRDRHPAGRTPTPRQSRHLAAEQPGR